MLNGIHAVTVAGCVVILAMTLYTWRSSGWIDFKSIGIVALIITLVVLQRMARSRVDIERE
jgi:intracellular septation protein A